MTFVSTGGLGGGGRGSIIVSGESGAANTGGGGGGVGTSTPDNLGGNGGSGVVIVRYLTGGVAAGVGGIVTTSGTYTVHVFNTSEIFRIIPSSDIIPEIDTTNQLTNLIQASPAGLTVARSVIINDAAPIVGENNINLTYKFNPFKTTSDIRIRSSIDNVANETTEPVLVYTYRPPISTSRQVVFNRENSNYIAATATVNTVRESENYVRPSNSNAFAITFASRPTFKNNLVSLTSDGNVVKNVFSQTSLVAPLLERPPDVIERLVVTNSTVVAKVRITFFTSSGGAAGSSRSVTSAPFGTAGVFVGGDGQLLIRGATEFWS